MKDQERASKPRPDDCKCVSVLVRCFQLSSPLHLPPYLSSPHERIPSERRPFEILPACLFLSSTRVFRGLHLCSSPLLSSPPLLASKEFTLYLLTHTSTARTHGARRNIFTVSLFFFLSSFFSTKVNTGRVLPCHLQSVRGCLRRSHPSDLYWSG